MKTTIFFLFILLSAASFAQNEDFDAYKNASGMKDPVSKIDAFKKFIVQFPTSTYRPRAFLALTNAYLDQNTTDSALVYADKYVNFYPVDGRLSAWENAAYYLAHTKKCLDSALSYSQKAVQFARSKNIRSIGQYLDTYASVLSGLSKNQEALDAEIEAIKGHENDPEYLLNLATYQEAVGKTTEALNNAAKVILLGDMENGLDKFNTWLAKSTPEATAQLKLKKEIAENQANDFLKSDEGKDQVSAKSSSAAFYGALRINLDTAEVWAKRAVLSINKDSKVENQIMFHKNLALVYSAEDKTNDALKELKTVQDYVDPWDSSFWLTLGKCYEKQNDLNKALDSYISGLYAFEAPSVKAAVMNLLPKLNLKEDDLKNLIEKKQKELTSFKTGKFKSKNNGRVLLAELFTGADCGPCQGADVAFDKLSEYFPRTSLAILEYHLNIPAPDPMTNRDTWNRYVFYGANFGTPTAIIEGKESITGGGPRFLAANRYNLYKYTLSKYESGKPAVTLTGSAKRKGDNINVQLNIKGKGKDPKEVIHVALVEKTVNYTGSNTIDKHRFVVRNFLFSDKGSSINSNKISGTFDVNKIEEGLKSYLDDPTKEPSWRPGFGTPSWRARPDKLDRKNLAVVAWIQNPETKEIVNCVYFDVK
jgi:tetratricopeptide (TPR) repeat protein